MQQRQSSRKPRVGPGAKDARLDCGMLEPLQEGTSDSTADTDARPRGTRQTTRGAIVFVCYDIMVGMGAILLLFMMYSMTHQRLARAVVSAGAPVFKELPESARPQSRGLGFKVLSKLASLNNAAGATTHLNGATAPPPTVPPLPPQPAHWHPVLRNRELSRACAPFEALLAAGFASQRAPVEAYVFADEPSKVRR